MKGVGILAKTFIITLLVLIALLFLTWMIPESSVSAHVDASVKLLKAESELWKEHFTYAWGAKLDNHTDLLMIRQAVSSADKNTSILFKVYYCNNYARYWHGYLVLLRPLLAVMSYAQIRYLFMAIHMSALVGVALRIDKRFGRAITYGWIASMIAVNFVCLPFSLQFSWVFFIMYGAICYIDLCYKRDGEGGNINILAFFMFVGMLTSFMDLLTAPILTLGMPLMYLLMLNIQYDEYETSGRNILTLINTSISWMAGYVGCWVMKWVLAIPVLKRNLLLDAFSRIALRTHGDMGGGERSSVIC